MAVLSEYVSLRIEEVRTFRGEGCLRDAQNSFEAGYTVTNSTKKFVQNGTVFVAKNWTSYVQSQIREDIEFLRERKNIIDPQPDNRTTRSIIEACYDSELRVRYFLFGTHNYLPYDRLKWLLWNPKQGFSSGTDNVHNGAYVFWTVNDRSLVTYSERQRWKQPSLTFYNEYYVVPFILEIMVQLAQYFPEDDSEFNQGTYEQITIKYLMKRLAGFSRMFQGFPDCSFRHLTHAFSKTSIKRLIADERGLSAVRIDSVLPVSILVNEILYPTTVAGIRAIHLFRII